MQPDPPDRSGQGQALGDAWLDKVEEKQKWKETLGTHSSCLFMAGHHDRIRP